MEQIIYGITAVIYAIFIIRFILSWVGGDFDLDTDSDLDLGDVVSFKGLTHFLMGSSGWLSLESLITHRIMWYDYIIAFILGIGFVIILYLVYKLMGSLETKPILFKGIDLVGHTGKIYLIDGIINKKGYFRYTITINNGRGTIELRAYSKQSYRLGDIVTVTNYEKGKYFI